MLGAAWIADRAVLPAIQASRRGRLVAIASREPSRARHLASSHSIPTVHDGYDAVLRDPEVDAVYIPLVNNLHRKWTLRALAAGKHVLCEKPLAMNAGEAEEMAAAAGRAGLCLMEAFMYRFHPRTRQFVERLRGEAAPLHVDARFGFRLSDRDNYRFHRRLGGGALLDVGCYCVNAARWLLGEPVEVFAHARRDPRTRVDMSVTTLLRFPGERTASLWCSFEAAEEQGVAAVTSRRSVALPRPFTAWRDPYDPYRLMVDSFAASVLTGAGSAVPIEDSIANMRVLDRIRAAAGI